MKRKRQNPIKLSQLRILLAVAEHNSFSEAALQLEMSQSAVSNAIATLECDLGVALFSRGRYGAYPTPVGRRVVAHAQQMMHLQEEILKEANQARSLQGGQVRLTSFRSVTTHLLPAIISQFRQRFPGVSISITEHLYNSNIEEDLRKGRADIGFIDHLMDDEFQTWELLQDEYVLLIPPSLQQEDSRVSWEQLSTYPLVISSEEDIHDQEVCAHFAAFGQTPNIVYQVRSDSSIMSMVAQGLGATIIPRLAAEPIPANVQVCSLPVPLFRVIRVAILADALLPPPVFAFLEMLTVSGRFSAQK